MAALRPVSPGAWARWGALVAALVAAAPTSAQLAAGDLLVTDFHNAVVWRVRPSGQVTAFSPRPGSGPNRLVRPAGIAVDPEGRVFVLDNDTGELVEIDPATGAQRALAVLLYDVYTGAYTRGTLGDGPYGLHIDPLGIATATANGSDELFQGGVIGDLAIFEEQPTTNLGPAGPYGVGALRVGVLGIIAIANGGSGWVQVDDLSGLDETPHAPFTTGGVVWDAAAVFSGMPGLLFTEQVPGGGVFGCNASASGLYASIPTVHTGSVSVGGLLRCPFALATSRGLADAYVTDAAQTVGGDARIVHVTLSGTPAQSLVATLPEGSAPTLPGGVVLVPEPAAGAGSLAALAALASRAGRRAQGRCAASGGPTSDAT